MHNRSIDRDTTSQHTGQRYLCRNNPEQEKSNLQQHHTVFSDLYRDIESEVETLADKNLSAAC